MKLYGLIGYPLGHSFSKQYFTEKFKAAGLLDCVFEAYAIPEINEFPSLIINNPSLKGLGVTIPYKEQVLTYLDELSPEVEAIGATNSIRIVDGKLKAFNTDIIGFETSFKKHLKSFHKKALILGTGGASKAVQYVLAKMGIPFFIVTRTKEDNKAHINYEDVNKEVIESHQLIINCTPVGMYPIEDNSPAIPYQFLTPHHYLYDLVYKPEKTIFLAKGEAAGATIENGYEMLILQAEASWKIWNEV